MKKGRRRKNKRQYLWYEEGEKYRNSFQTWKKVEVFKARLENL